ITVPAQRPPSCLWMGRRTRCGRAAARAAGGAARAAESQSDLEALAGGGVEDVLVARARAQEHGLAHPRDHAAVRADDERLLGVTAVELRVAVDVRVRAKLFDQVHDERDATLARADEFAVLGPETNGDPVAAAV